MITLEFILTPSCRWKLKQWLFVKMKVHSLRWYGTNSLPDGFQTRSNTARQTFVLRVFPSVRDGDLTIWQGGDLGKISHEFHWILTELCRRQPDEATRPEELTHRFQLSLKVYRVSLNPRCARNRSPAILRSALTDPRLRAHSDAAFHLQVVFDLSPRLVPGR